MKSRKFVSLLAGGLVILLNLFVTTPVQAQQPTPTADVASREVEFENDVLAELRAIDPDAAALFEQATLVLDSGDPAAAKLGFQKVLVLVPQYSHALRRLSQAEVYLGEIDQAEAHARQALALDAADYNQANLAMILLTKGGAAADTEALELALLAVEANPDDVYNELVLMYAGGQRSDLDAMRLGSDYLVQAVPEFAEAHLYAGVVAADDGRWERAETQLLMARQLGYDAEIIDGLLDDGVRTQASLMRLARAGLFTLGGWLGIMLVLFGLGVVLSRITLAALNREPVHPDARPSLLEQGVRFLYSAVIGLASLYFYISLPMLILITVALVAGIIYLFYMIGRIPVQLIFALVLGGLVSIFAIVRSLFVLQRDDAPGRPLNREEAPQLWTLTAEVAQKLKTHPIEAIYLTPGTEIAVMERGGLLRKMFGQGKRSLIIGLGAIKNLDQGQLRAILAHEYGHFSNRDTAGGGLANRVLLSMQQMGRDLVMNRQAVWWNPAWLFVNAYIRLFVRITHGASRLQEILADRYAALAYGAGNFIDSLQQVVRQSVIFDYHLNAAVKEWAEAPILQASDLPEAERAKFSGSIIFRTPNLKQLYAAGFSGADEPDLQAAIQTAFDAKTSAYDTHPSLNERVQMVRALPSELSLIDRAPAGDLLLDAEALQVEMEEQISQGILNSLGRQVIAQIKAAQKAGAG